MDTVLFLLLSLLAFSPNPIVAYIANVDFLSMENDTSPDLGTVFGTEGPKLRFEAAERPLNSTSPNRLSRRAIAKLFLFKRDCGDIFVDCDDGYHCCTDDSDRWCCPSDEHCGAHDDDSACYYEEIYSTTYVTYTDTQTVESTDTVNSAWTTEWSTLWTTEYVTVTSSNVDTSTEYETVTVTAQAEERRRWANVPCTSTSLPTQLPLVERSQQHITQNTRSPSSKHGWFKRQYKTVYIDVTSYTTVEEYETIEVTSINYYTETDSITSTWTSTSVYAVDADTTVTETLTETFTPETSETPPSIPISPPEEPSQTPYIPSLTSIVVSQSESSFSPISTHEAATLPLSMSPTSVVGGADSQTTKSSSGAGGGLSRDVQIGIGVGVSFAGVLLLLLLGLLLRHCLRRRNKSRINTPGVVESDTPELAKGYPTPGSPYNEPHYSPFVSQAPYNGYISPGSGSTSQPVPFVQPPMQHMDPYPYRHPSPDPAPLANVYPNTYPPPPTAVPSSQTPSNSAIYGGHGAIQPSTTSIAAPKEGQGAQIPRKPIPTPVPNALQPLSPAAGPSITRPGAQPGPPIGSPPTISTIPSSTADVRMGEGCGMYAPIPPLFSDPPEDDKHKHKKKKKKKRKKNEYPTYFKGCLY